MLRLPPSADLEQVKRAYRKLALDHHPDAGGDPAGFHELQQAYELLIARGDGGRPARAAGRPSRHRAAWTSERGRPEPVDVAAVAWDRAVPTGAVTLDRDQLAVLLATEHAAPVHPVTATSRAPRSRLNRLAAVLADDLTSQLRIGPARDDRGGLVVATTVTAGNRRARKALDGVALDGGWVRTRASSTTTLRLTVHPDGDRRVTATRAVVRLEDLLDRLDWPLRAWMVTAADG